MTDGMCGNCGARFFTVKLEGHPDSYESMQLECTTCHSTTVLTPTRPQLRTTWGEKSNGILCPDYGVIVRRTPDKKRSRK